MYNGQIIGDLLKERRIPIKNFLEAMEWSSHSQYRQFVKGNPTARILERVADFLKVPIDTLFIREHSVPPAIGKPQDFLQKNDSAMFASKINDERIEVLERLLEEKDKRIQLLEKLVQTLENK